MGRPTFDFGYKTLEEVAERITNASGAGQEEHTPEYLAAAYAVQSQSESGCEVCEGSAMEHFDTLRVAGAEFDVIDALRLLNLDD
ncbi:hypothetical protein VIBNIFTn2_1110008 [Vibrio nigripulchritudo FTn2]|uniref:hypothetical protein n=1 Tax=Vibrio nigripulchritudo TaxID=28173 RepID=UPI0003B18F18|nr:hypothetical protein [Vibrio nigripulchritudo]BCL74201.1 hypothetical protein VNTUMSATTG_61380 [Vibrio nigripulchritudo]CCN39710.1 hypothetical protein VIBNIFTn2_1110008 [Vibrio nigripulchritudo FTn2]